MISTAASLILLQSLREVVFSQNLLSIVKELGQLKNLNLLDISSNKISEFDKLIPLQNLKKMTILSLKGNFITKQANYEANMNKILPQVKVLDPDLIRDYSQFSSMENVCFSDPPEQTSMIFVE